MAGACGAFAVPELLESELASVLIVGLVAWRSGRISVMSEAEL